MTDIEVTELEDLDPDDAALFENEPDEDRVQFVKGGRVIVRIGEARYGLRRPKFGPYTKLREQVEAVFDVLSELSELKETMKNLREITEGGVEDLEDLPEIDTSKIDQLSDTLAATAQEWWSVAFEKCSVNDDRPDEDEYPVWFTEIALIQHVMTHWRSSPLVRGKPQPQDPAG
ncbi:MAG: hypothetical protein AAGA99_26385 [Actinomycetota bacterium]